MLGTQTLGGAVLGGKAGGAQLLSGALDFVVVVQHAVTGAADFIVLVTSPVQGSLDFIVAANGLLVGALDFIIVEKQRSNLSEYQLIGNNLAAPIDPNRDAVWSTNNRPTSPSLYQAGINTQTHKREWWDGTDWRDGQGNIVT